MHEAEHAQIIDATEGDLGQRGEIVNLVASGMEVEQAIKEVLGVTTTKETARRVKEVGDPEKKADKELTDEAWFLQECGTFADLLSDNDQYKSEAILFHQISEARNKFRMSIKKTMANYKEGRKGKNVGWFFLSLYSDTEHLPSERLAHLRHLRRQGDGRTGRHMSGVQRCLLSKQDRKVCLEDLNLI